MNRVLVIEDDPEILENIEEILELQSYQTLATSSSLTGLQLAKEMLPSLVICDVIMPGIDGYAVLSELRQQTETATIPFIFLTGRADRADIRLGMELGADDYLTKPFTQAELIGAVQSCLTKYDRLSRQYKSLAQQTQTLERQLQTLQELADLNRLLLQQLCQGLRHPVSNLTIATYLLKQDIPKKDFDRYLAILEEECTRSTALLSEVASLQEYLHPSKLNLLRSKLNIRLSP
ncbi:response regulator [Leptolyngbya sp. FACHB-17]|uniref:response regulator transcription factor n=1 Tax=unclassified Leptolyngbya TaxID=2650499 RepID=UPI001680F156|nr:response regulator [Leptolyngbya sp. FACHB-17]MBD2080234.1 response regulator [Leptolyngbya sp. FACHB-17]